MSREAIEVGAFTWSRIQRLYDPDASQHWQRCESEGLQCPQEVFTQLFHEQSNNEDFAVIVRSIDWGRVRWELQQISGIAMRHFRAAREYQHTLDEARDQATSFGIVDERQDVVDTGAKGPAETNRIDLNTERVPSASKAIIFRLLA